MTIQERLDAYLVHLVDEKVVTDDMSWEERHEIMSEAIYRYLVDNDIRVEFNLPRLP